MNSLPKMNMDDNETGCCPRFHPDEWNEKIIEFDNLLFAKAKSKSLMHIPLNFGSVMKHTMAAIAESDAEVNDQYLILSRDLSSWKGEHLFLVSKEVKGMEMTHLSGRFASKVFEGEFKEQAKWMGEMESYVKQLGETGEEIYAFYTTCPKCAAHYGKNYVVLMMKLA